MLALSERLSENLSDGISGWKYLPNGLFSDFLLGAFTLVRTRCVWCGVQAGEGRDMARWLIVAGVVLIVVGVLMHIAPWLFNWFGRLPGDIRIESERSRVYVPIVSMIILSVVLSVIISFFRR
ncbi:Protein of unknown function [Microbulbifer donghaiensis]|uniref:DUF2905 domain-containing protein n=1 Tax=Microbulbifer donghaiensis TaxID=494016 RepID=A0A1M4VX50_9GAMM|nr:DUF2905 domain-containing protein [Microbulbifer donghaiensis]SHE73561.1 Protein of unknown function [Microbulbifer donghaiensis]